MDNDITPSADLGTPPVGAAVHAPPRWRWMVYLFGLLNSSLVGGTVFGWPAVKEVLLHEGVYLDECEVGETSCDSQELKLQVIFTVGFYALLASRLFFGLFLDRVGPFFTCILASAFSVSGALFFAFSDPSSGFDMFAVGFFLIGFGGPGVHLSNFHLCNLFPDKKASVISSFTAVFSLSGLVFVVLKAVWEAGEGITRRDMFLMYGGVTLFVFVDCLLIQPRKRFDPHDGVVFQCGFKRVKVDSVAVGNVTERKRRHPKLDTLPVKQQLASKEFIFLCMWFSCMALQLQYYVATGATQLEDLGDSGTYSTVFQIVGSIGFIALPLVGYLFDFQGYSLGTSGAPIFAVLSHIIPFIDNLEIQVLGFAFWSIARLFLFASFFSFIPETFGFRTFGLLSGIASVIAAIFGVLHLAAVAITLGPLDSNYKVFHGVYGVMCFCMLFFPGFIWKREGETKNHDRMEKNRISMDSSNSSSDSFSDNRSDSGSDSDLDLERA